MIIIIIIIIIVIIIIIIERLARGGELPGGAWPVPEAFLASFPTTLPPMTPGRPPDEPWMSPG
eukprot:6362703-Karenia_brevis.AAC.1